MAYKDEYEVARLLLDDAAADGYQAVGGPNTTVTYHLHPPMLRSLGLDRKLKLRALGRAGVRGVAGEQERPRHVRRPVPLGRGAQGRAGDDPRVRRRAATR